MKVLLAALVAIFSWLPSAAAAPTTETKDTRCYELRVYFAAPGKLDALHARFRDHTKALFSKHGMEHLGYWTPITNPEHKLVYILSYPSRAAREVSWKNFLADPQWIAARDASETNGTLVAKVDSTFLHAADFSPPIKATAPSPARAFELRTYTAADGKMATLQGRFRRHTVVLFAKHGMTNFGYWLLDHDQKNAENTLIYLLAHKSQEAAAASFQAFRTDAEWLAAKEASEKAAGGSLTTKDGVQTVLMVPTDYSPTQ